MVSEFMILVILADVDELEFALPFGLCEHGLIYLGPFCIDDAAYIESFVFMLMSLTSYGITE